MQGRPSPCLRNPTQMIRLLLIASISLGAGCTSRPTVLPSVPETVTVVVEKYITVPEDLTAPCEVYEPRENTYAEAKRLALLRRESIEQCNRDKEKIRSLSGEKM